MSLRGGEDNEYSKGQQRGMAEGASNEKDPTGPKGLTGLTSPTGLTGKHINGTTATKDMAHYSA